jgi:hypothetical protein
MPEQQPASSWKVVQDQQKKAAPATDEATIIFQKLSAAEPVRYYKVALHGQQKSGKTRGSLTFPDPIYVIATEPGLRPLIKLFPNKEIYFVDVYEVDPNGVFEVEPTKTLAKIDAAVKLVRQKACENPANVGTVVVDSVTDIWKWVQEWMKMDILKIDKTARVRQQWDWGYANSKYQNIIMQLLSLPCHLVLTAQDKEEYAGPGEGSGVYSPRWMAQTPYWVDIIIGLVKLHDPKTGVTRYMANIEDSRHMDEALNPIAGKDFENFDFNKLKELIEKKS